MAYKPLGVNCPYSYFWCMEKYKAGLFIIFVIFCSFTGLVAQPVADFEADTTFGCAPFIVSFKDKSINAVSWHWNTGVGTSTLKNPGVIYLNPGVYTITLVVTDGNGLKDTLTRVSYIEAHGKPVANFTASATDICTFDQVSFSDLSNPGTGNINSWTWDFGDGNTSTVANPTHTYTSPGNYPVSLIVSNQYNCTDDKIINAYIKVSAPDVSFSATNLLACGPPLTTQFTSTGDTTGTHTWYFGDGTTSNQVHPSHVYTSNGSFTVTHIIEDAQGCRDTLTKDALVNIGVNTLSITASDSSICLGDTVFFATNAASNSSVTWDFGNGDTASGFLPYYIYNSSGTYNVVATVSDQSGCVNDLELTIDVYNYPNAFFHATTPRIGCEVPFTVQFQPVDTTAITYIWQFYDGTSSTQMSPAHTYTTIDSFNVRLTLFGPGGCSSKRTFADYVQIRDVQSGFMATPTRGCAPIDVAFTDTTQSPFPIVSWFWDFGDGTTSTLQHPSHTYADTGYYDVTLVTVNDQGCTDTTIIHDYISAGKLPTIDFTADTNQACALTDIQFINLSSQATSFIWFFGDGDTAMSTNPTHGFAALGDVDVMLLGSDRGCWDTLLKPGFVNILAPLPVIGISQKKICELPIDVQYNNMSLGADHWSWTLHDTITHTDPSFIYTYTTEGFHHVEITVSNDSTGCVVSASDSIYIHPIVADFQPDTNRGCVPLEINFTDLSTNAVEWHWDFGTGDTSLKKNPRYIYKDPGDFDVQLIVENSLKCKDTLLFSPGISALGVNADFKALDPNAGCVPLDLNFEDLSSGTGTITNWFWDLGDGTTANTQNTSHTYTSQNYYDIKLVVEDVDGCVDSVIKDNFVFATQPVPAFGVNPPSNCPDINSVFVTLSSGVGLSYLWDFGDGNTSHLANTTHAYQDTGFYDITLHVTDVNGCDTTLTKPNFVEIRELIADFWADTTYAPCPPLTVNFSADNSFPHVGVNWFWDFGDGATSSQVFPSHVYTSPGIYTVKLILTSPVGCSDTMVWDNMIEIKGPITTFSFNPNEGCPGTPIDFTASSPEDSIIYEWIFGDGNTAQGQNVTYAYQTPGQYVPVLKVEDNLGCQIFSVAPDTITVFDQPVASFTANTSVLCDAGDITFIDQSSTSDIIVGWFWDFGDGQTDTVQYPVHHYSQLGTYDVSLIVTTNNGCSDSVFMPGFIQVVPSPSPSILVTDSAGCMPLTVDFSALDNNHPYAITSYLWDFDYQGITAHGQQATFVYPSDGIFTPELTVEDVNECSTTVSRNIVVYPLPEPDFVASDSFGCAPFTVTFNDRTPSNITDWIWEFGDGLTSSDQTPVHTYLQDGIYTVSLTVWDDKGCSETLTKNQYIHLSHPVADFEALETVICPGNAAVFNNISSSDTLISAWQWDFGNGTVSTDQHPSYVYPISGQYSVSLVVTDVFGCSDSISKEDYVEVLLDYTPKVLEIQYVSVLSDNEVEIIFDEYPNVYDDFGRYVIYRENSNGDFDSVGVSYTLTQTKWIDSGINTTDNSLCYKVRVINHCGNTYDIDLASAHCTVNLTTTALVEEVQLDWTPYIGWDDVELYHVFRVNNYNPGQMTLIATMPGNARQVIDRDMFCYDVYSYRVVAVGGNHYESFSDTAFAAPVHIPPSDQSHITRVTVENNSFVQVEWDAAMIDKADKVVIQRSNGQGFQNVYVEPIGQQNIKYQDLNTNVNGQAYTYQVFTVDSCGDYTPAGRKGKSILLKAERIAGSIHLNWNHYEGWDNGVEEYEIQLLDEAGSNFGTIERVPGTQNTYADKTSSLDQAVNCYRIIAWESGGTGTTSTSNEACVVLDPQIYSATAFTPNNDGINDEFTITGVFLYNYNLEIFNRWGEKIFVSNSVDNAWDGKTISGEPAQEGVYVFVASGTGAEGQRIQKIGSITLLR